MFENMEKIVIFIIIICLVISYSLRKYSLNKKKQMNNEENATNIEIITLIEPNNEFDISILNFKPLGVKLLKIDSQEFNTFLETYAIITRDGIPSTHHQTIFNQLMEESHNTIPFAVVPDSIIKMANYAKLNQSLFLPYQILQIISPSKLFVKSQLSFDVDRDNKILHNGLIRTYHDNSYHSYPDKKINIENIEVANKLIEKFSRMREIKPFKTSMESYINSFEMSHYSMQFLNLIMSFEGLIEGPNELSYRLKRGIAILCGTSIDSCENIFSNITKAYSLRSKIAHGENPDLKLVHQYLPYFIYLASRFLIELLNHEFSDKTKLNKLLNQSGYNSASSLSTIHEELIIEDSIFNYVLTYELPKK